MVVGGMIQVGLPCSVARQIERGDQPGRDVAHVALDARDLPGEKQIGAVFECQASGGAASAN